MSRKRDTNWTRDEISVLLDSIMEITKTHAADGRRTHSTEVFEYAAKKLGEKGHTSRAEREKCRTKWKKMKEEFNHAKKAIETGEGRVAPGIEPFYSRMLEFNNGNYQNLSLNSTKSRRSSSISSSTNNISYSSNSNLTNNQNGNSLNNSINTDNRSVSNSSPLTTTPSTGSNGTRPTQSGSRASARIAANSNGMVSNDTSDTSSTTVTKLTNPGGTDSDYSPVDPTSAEFSPVSRQNLRLMASATTNGTSGGISNGNFPSVAPIQNDSVPINHHPQLHRQQNTTMQIQPNDPQRLIPDSHTYNLYNSFTKHNSEVTATTTNGNTNSSSTNGTVSNAHRDTDISYRVSSGFRQITIFGHHDVDIKFRENCVTINKIGPDCASSSAGGNDSDR